MPMNTGQSRWMLLPWGVIDMSLTARQLAGYQSRSLRSIRERLLRMAAEWDDVDQFNLNSLESLADQVEATSAAMMVEDAS